MAKIHLLAKTYITYITKPNLTANLDPNPSKPLDQSPNPTGTKIITLLCCSFTVQHTQFFIEIIFQIPEKILDAHPTMSLLLSAQCRSHKPVHHLLPDQVRQQTLQTRNRQLRSSRVQSGAKRQEGRAASRVGVEERPA